MGVTGQSIAGIREVGDKRVVRQQALYAIIVEGFYDWRNPPGA